MSSRRVWLALGSNLGDRMTRLSEAVTALRRGGGVAVDSTSSVYETPPWGGIAQPDYLNAVVSGTTDLSAHGILALCKAIESAAGRDFLAPRNSARPIDVDVLLIEGETVSTPDLEVPHPAMHQRAFVLVPLAEIAPRLVYPGTASSIAQLLAALPWEERAAVRAVNDRGWAGPE